jgi:hypothetical protein
MFDSESKEKGLHRAPRFGACLVQMDVYSDGIDELIGLVSLAAVRGCVYGCKGGRKGECDCTE